MLNGLWAGMIVVSFICAAVTGHMEGVSMAAAEGADKAIRLLLSMAGVMCLWSGMMNITEKSGLAKLISKCLSPILGRLMPDYKKGSRAMQAVCANVTANLLGLGNAATPLGILAMKEMQKSNRLKTQPNHSMIVFVILNTASVQLIPATIAAMRQAAGSQIPYAVLPYIWISSAGALMVGIIMAKLLSFCLPQPSVSRRKGGMRLRNG